MDLIKIGKYIAGKRKALGFTQKQLAEKLGMSDKSVSKWERGVCLPDVSVYSELCGILGISINEFLAGEDIEKERIAQKAEENLISVASDNDHKQKHLKRIIFVLLAIMLAVLLFGGVFLLRSRMPQNYIIPADRDSLEVKTIRTLFGSENAFLYHYTTTDDYTSLILYISEYHAGKLVNKENFELGYEDIGSPQNGAIYIVPDLEHFQIKLIIADDSTTLSTKIPILEDVSGRESYGRSATQIEGKTSIEYGQEQGLAALIYDPDSLRIGSIQEYEQGIAPAVNDYVYYFSCQFCK